MVSVPGAAPVTVAVPLPVGVMVAIAARAVAHEPPVVASVSDMAAPAQRVAGPEMATGVAGMVPTEIT